MKGRSSQAPRALEGFRRTATAVSVPGDSHRQTERLLTVHFGEMAGESYPIAGDVVHPQMAQDDTQGKDAGVRLRLPQALTAASARGFSLIEYDGTFAMQWNFQQERPGNWTLRDKPSFVHGRGANLCFLDGHVETHRWVDKRTVSAPRDDAVELGDVDVQWMLVHGTITQ